MVLSPQMMTATAVGQNYWLFKVKMRVIFQPQFFLFRHSGPAGTLTKLPATGLLYVAKDMLGREGVVKIDTGVLNLSESKLTQDGLNLIVPKLTQEVLDLSESKLTLKLIN